MFALAALMGGVGCASAPVTVTVPEPEVAPSPVSSNQAVVVTTSPETYGPSPAVSPSPEVSASPSPSPSVSPDPSQVNYGPTPVAIRPVVLVLGPGLARGFSAVGAIRSLSEAHIPIGAVLGTEVGGLIGAIYSMGGKINQFEWALLKLRDEVLMNSGGILPERFQRAAKIKRLEVELERIFENKDLTQATIPIRLVLQKKDTNGTVLLERGSAAAAVRAVLADPEVFGPSEWEGAPVVSAAKTHPFLVAEAKALNIGPVVVINALEEMAENSAAASSDLKDADLVIRPDLSGIGPLDFQKRTDAAFRGKGAVDRQLAQIRSLVGLPPEPELQKDGAP